MPEGTKLGDTSLICFSHFALRSTFAFPSSLSWFYPLQTSCRAFEGRLRSFLRIVRIFLDFVLKPRNR